MAYRVVYAPEAADQLEALYAYIAERRSPPVAQRYTTAVIDTCEGLAHFPLRGVPRDNIRAGLRVTHHRGRTVIAYAVDVNTRTVSVVGVFHGGQDHEGALTEGGEG